MNGIVHNVNYFGPNKHDINLFIKLKNSIKDFENTKLIIGGDLNLTLNPQKDSGGGNMNTHSLCTQKFSTMMEEYDLLDIWRMLHSDLKRSIWNSRTVSCRLEYFAILVL